MKLFDLLFGRMIDSRIQAFQNDLISRHYVEVENMYQTMRGWRHDYHNHIQALLGLLTELDEEEAKPLREYLLNINKDLTTLDTVIKTGNVMIDAILNSKLSLIRSNGIAVKADASVPTSLAISDVDLCRIIGNLLDNVLEACLRQKEEEERFIRVYIGIMKRQLYISVVNSMTGRAGKRGKLYVSSKKQGTEEHGFGLLNIDRTVKKYGGFVNRQNEEDVFATEVLLPLGEKEE